MLNALKISGLTCLRLIDESSATAFSYGWFRPQELLEDETRLVAFIDIGHSKTTVTIGEFTKTDAKVLLHCSDRDLGGRDLDYKIMKMLSDSFKSDYDEDPSLDNRARLKMLDAAKYARTILSGDTETEINIDYLLNDEDLVLKLSRVEF